MKKSLLILLLFSTLTCEKISFDDQLTLPVVELLEVEDISTNGVTFKAITHAIGEEEILRSYINWYPSDRVYFIDDELYKMDINLVDKEEVSYYLDRDLLADQVYAARIVIELEQKKIYSNSVIFESMGASNQAISFRAGNLPYTGPGERTAFTAWEQDNFYLVDDGRLWSYSLVPDTWQVIADGYPLVFKDYFQYVGNDVYCAAFNGTLVEEGLWRCDFPTRQCERIGDVLPFRGGQPGSLHFSFILDGLCYVQYGQGNFAALNLTDFQGLTELNDVPFPTNVIRHYGFAVNEMGYVLVGPQGDQEDLPFFPSQFWQFDPTTSQWNRLSDFPGTGQIHFAVSTDQERYIYVGMGAQSNLQRQILEGDMWRYDVIDQKWEFIGYGPKGELEVIPSRNAIELEGTVLCALRDGESSPSSTPTSSRYTMMLIDPSKIWTR